VYIVIGDDIDVIAGVSLIERGAVRELTRHPKRGERPSRAASDGGLRLVEAHRTRRLQTVLLDELETLRAIVLHRVRAEAAAEHLEPSLRSVSFSSTE